jgi:hypothetical protein
MNTHNKVVLTARGLRVATQLGLPEDHVTLMDCYWRDHPIALKTKTLVEEILEKKKEDGWKIYGITGASGSGKDSCVDAIFHKMHMRFGDFMKDWAHELGMVPHDRVHYENNREARNEKLWNGKTALDAWIALDVIRHYNPFIFVESGLQSVLNQMDRAKALGVEGTVPLIFSGMRTELGLDIVREISDSTFRVIREGHEPPKNATLDELQVIYPVDAVIVNNSTLEHLEDTAKSLLVE